MNRANDIVDELKSIGSNLGSLPRTMPYAVPEGYFDNFARNTLAVIDEISAPEIVPEWPKTLPHYVPSGYFEGLADSIISNVNSGQVVTGLSKDAPFSVPAGYFDALPAQLLAAAKAADTVQKTAKIIPLKRTLALGSIKWAAAAILL